MQLDEHSAALKLTMGFYSLISELCTFRDGSQAVSLINSFFCVRAGARSTKFVNVFLKIRTRLLQWFNVLAVSSYLFRSYVKCYVVACKLFGFSIKTDNILIGDFGKHFESIQALSFRFQWSWWVCSSVLSWTLYGKLEKTHSFKSTKLNLVMNDIKQRASWKHPFAVYFSIISSCPYRRCSSQISCLGNRYLSVIAIFISNVPTALINSNTCHTVVSFYPSYVEGKNS